MTLVISEIYTSRETRRRTFHRIIAQSIGNDNRLVLFLQEKELMYGKGSGHEMWGL